MNHVRHLTDEQLAKIACDDEHPLFDFACIEEDFRACVARDPSLA